MFYKLTAIRDTHVVKTFLGGVEVYDAAAPRE
jgi:hypothetical protein